MTVIIKELVVRTGVVENKNTKASVDTSQLKSEIIQDCLKELNRRLKKSNER